MVSKRACCGRRASCQLARFSRSGRGKLAACPTVVKPPLTLLTSHSFCRGSVHQATVPGELNVRGSRSGVRSRRQKKGSSRCASFWGIASSGEFVSPALGLRKKIREWARYPRPPLRCDLGCNVSARWASGQPGDREGPTGSSPAPASRDRDRGGAPTDTAATTAAVRGLRPSGL